MRLLVSPPPSPGELLSSYALRLALANRLRPVRFMRVLGLPTFWERDADVHLTPEEIAVLAAATGYPLERLLECSLMPMLERLLEQPRTDVTPRYVVRIGRDRGVRGHPLCVACVRETGVMLREWRLTTSVVCERHRVPLIDACPGCGTLLHHAAEHRTYGNRLRLMVHRPDVCPGCRAALPEPAPLSADLLGFAGLVQSLMRQATRVGWVAWSGLRLTGHEFDALLESVLRLHYPGKVVSGRANWRPETATLRERFGVVVAGGQDMAGGLLALLRRWRRRRVVPTRVFRAGGKLPGWFRDLLMLTLSPETQGLPGGSPGSLTFRFTEGQWQVVAPVVPPERQTRRGEKPVREILEAWFTRSLRGTRQQDWVGEVSYPTMFRHLNRLMAGGVLDAVVERMLGGLPECRFVLTAPETVGGLTRLRSRHAEHLWTLMAEEALARLDVERE
ncbi:TniQ family protein [Deinococcus budaensis]|uniref:TniQ domain-containing protein n=1 Tax=Deinococcus budaensis TaxID=1665626 RepID=A0A7W8GCC5_9DEIO|nr:TniQ family protein [Deinococcus budaensis]MBB5232961.1 hypothetical protein [Deinococcus budaensis]